MTKELQTILKESNRLRSNGEKAILATVVDVRGSSYRLPGAKMLISAEGKTFGTVSGGCLEADVMERAKTVLKTGAAQVVTYDTRGNEESVFSLNMGCNGIVRILLESIENNFIFEFIKNCFEKNQRGVMATLIEAPEELKNKIGTRLFVDAEKSSKNFDLVNINQNLVKDALIALESEKSCLQTYDLENGKHEFFLEVVKPPLSLVIFGAGHDAISLFQLAKNLEWNVSIVDHRAVFATAERFPNADKIILSRPEKLSENVLIGENTVAVMMTHNYAHDRQVLRFLLNSNASYIGALGPKRRTESLLQDLHETGDVFTDAQLEKLYGPVGLDIGADTPELIALSIIAEINAVLARRTGGFLRERQGSIYGRSIFVD